jgi:acyl-coenzyme A thioesterase PaaI-like protein
VSLRLAHQDLCFGCGLSNPFGLHLDARSADAESIAGRFFVKQDHQGPDGTVHPGILAAVLLEAVSLAGGRADAARLELPGSPPVGTFVAVEASVDQAVARDERTGEEVARARCPRT